MVERYQIIATNYQTGHLLHDIPRLSRNQIFNYSTLLVKILPVLPGLATLNTTTVGICVLFDIIEQLSFTAWSPVQYHFYPAKVTEFKRGFCYNTEHFDRCVSTPTGLNASHYKSTTHSFIGSTSL